MNTLQMQYGYDAVFTSETPEYIRCTVCQLVLRNPIQIIKCGHKFCSPCFTRLKEYSVQMRSELLCPVDRELIDLEKICEDHGLRRAVSNLSVKCDRWEEGCLWQGELSELDHHEQRCEFHPQGKASPSAHELSDLVATVNYLKEKMESYEQELERKEKENNHMKHSIRELKQQSKAELLTMAEKIAKIDMESRERNLAFEREIKLLNEKNDSLEKEIEELKKNCHISIKKQPQHEKLEDEIKSVNDHLIKEKRSDVDAEPRLKRIVTFSHFKCTPAQVKIDPFNGWVEFKENMCLDYVTVVARVGGVPMGDKAFYEVTLSDRLEGDHRIGWVNNYFLTSKHSTALGGCSSSFGYNPKSKRLINRNRFNFYGVEVDLSNSTVIGVAIDMVRGEIMYGINGNWNLGTAFKNINKNVEYFPAIAGFGASKVCVNFAEKDITYGPPNSSFKRIVDIQF